MMFGEGKLLIGSSDRGSELERLRTPDQIALFIEQQRALVSQAHREEAEQRVRHLKFDLVQRAVILALAVSIGIALAIGSAASPLLLRDAGVAGSLLAAATASLYGYRARRVKGES
jgi:hypothetical protein